MELSASPNRLALLRPSKSNKDIESVAGKMSATALCCNKAKFGKKEGGGDE